MELWSQMQSLRIGSLECFNISKPLGRASLAAPQIPMLGERTQENITSA